MPPTSDLWRALGAITLSTTEVPISAAAAIASLFGFVARIVSASVGRWLKLGELARFFVQNRSLSPDLGAFHREIDFRLLELFAQRLCAYFVLMN